MRHPEPKRFADKDPWAIIEEARAQRGPIVTGWLVRVLGQQSNPPGSPSLSQPGMPSGRSVNGFT